MTFTDNYDPGWNDPPIFTYDKATAIQTAAASKKGAFLNKRVAFPISGSIGNSPSGTQRTSFPNTESGPLPPMFHPSASPNDYVINEVHNSNVLPNSYSSDKVKLDEVLKNLKIDTDCDEEIKKRIKIMEKMWLENKLKKVVQLRILELSKGKIPKKKNKFTTLI